MCLLTPATLDDRTARAARGEGRWHEPDGAYAYIELEVDEVQYNIDLLATRRASSAEDGIVAVDRSVDVKGQAAGNRDDGG